jgi:FMN reductase
MSTPSTRSLAVVSAGLSEPSSSRLLADRLTAAVDRHLRDRGIEPVVEVVELRELAQDLANHLLTGFPTPKLQAALDAVLAADGVIAVTPVYSASYSGLFKMFVDVLEPGLLDGMPVLVAATAGTPRHSLVLDHALRPLFSYLRAVVVPTGVFAASEDFGSTADGQLASRIERAAVELADLVAGTVRKRDLDDELESLPFEELLRRA